MGRRRWLTAAVVAAAGAGVAMASAGNFGWQWVSPLPPQVELRQVVWAENQYVAVGGSGVIVTSRDGRSWTLQDSDTSAYLTDVVWNGSELVAVGRDPGPEGGDEAVDLVVVTSHDGHHWTEEVRLPRAPSWIFDVACTATGACVVVDGSRWEAVRGESGRWSVDDNAFPSAVDAVASNGAVLLAAGRESYLSNDGQSWQTGGVPPGSYSWPGVSRASTLHRRVELEWNKSRFVVVTGDTVAASTDGKQWSELLQFKWDHGYQSATVLGVSQAAIVVGGFGRTDDYSSDWSWIQVSTDAGVTWGESSRLVGASRNSGLQGMTWGDAGWVAVGLAGDTLLSTDAILWSCPQGGYCEGPDELWFHAAAAVGRGAAAVGGGLWDCGTYGSPYATCSSESFFAQRGADGPWTIDALLYPLNSHRLASSGDEIVGLCGKTTVCVGDGHGGWMRVEGVMPSHDAAQDIAWGDGTYVVVGESHTAMSPNGVAWSSFALGDDQGLARVVPTDVGFLAIGLDWSTIFASPDGVAWVPCPSQAGDDVWSIAQGGGRIVAVGGPAGLRTFSEREGWVQAVVPAASLGSVAFDGTRFAAVGRSCAQAECGSYRDGQIVTVVSRDATHWTLFPYLGPAPGVIDIEEVFATSTGFVGVGENRTLVEATDFGTLLELDPPVGRIPLNQPATLQVGIDEARDEPTQVLLGASSGAIQVPRLATIPAGATSVGVPIRGTRVEAGVEIRAELSDSIGGGVAVSRLSVEGRGPRRPGGRSVAPVGEAAKAARIR